MKDVINAAVQQWRSTKNRAIQDIKEVTALMKRNWILVLLLCCFSVAKSLYEVHGEIKSEYIAPFVVAIVLVNLAGFALLIFLYRIASNSRTKKVDFDNSVYELSDNAHFNISNRELNINGGKTPLSPQMATLLEAFLKAKKGSLTQQEIYELLWSDGSGTPERLYTVISRLRKTLESVPSLYIDCNIDTYQLKQRNK